MADDREVLSSLPRSRPSRRSTKRDGGTAAAGSARDGGTSPRRPAEASPGRKARSAAGRSPDRPAPPPAGYAIPEASPDAAPTDPLTTAVQAAGELARLGLTAGGQAVKGVLSRIPRP